MAEQTPGETDGAPRRTRRRGAHTPGRARRAGARARRGGLVQAARLSAQAVVLAATVAGTVVHARQSVAVTLVVDGVATTLHAGAPDVSGLLADRGVHVGPRDVVLPAPEAALQDGTRVEVRYARPLTLDVDGRVLTLWTTERTLDSALDALRVHTAGARLSVSRSQPLGRQGLEVVVSHPKQVTLVADGRRRVVTTTAPTVTDLLLEEGVGRDADDRLSLPAGAVLRPGTVVAVSRVTHRRVVVAETVPPRVVRRSDPTLATGREAVVHPGASGAQQATYDVEVVDGRAVVRRRVAATVLRPAVDRVVRIGTRRATPDAVPGADGLNWAALARCESGGNPRAVNPAGYYGLYQFSLSTWRAVGGTGSPVDASPAEQLHRAKVLYHRAGAGQWGCGRHLYD